MFLAHAAPHFLAWFAWLPIFGAVAWGGITGITRRDIIPELQDVIYKSNPLWLYLYQKLRVMTDGGYHIEEPLLTGQPVASSYTRWQTLSVTPVELTQNLTLDWKWYQVPAVIDGPSEAVNAGVLRVLDLVAIALQSAELQIRDQLGSDLYATGTPVASALDPMPLAIDDGSSDNSTPTSYAGITRTTSGFGNFFWNSYVATGSSNPPSRSLFQQTYGKVTFGSTAPDLIVTTQRVFDQLWEIAAAQQRYDEGDEFTLGAPFLRFNRARIMVDQHCPAGYAFFLNTDFIKLKVLNTRNFFFTGWLQGLSQDARVGRIFWAGNLIVQNPRFQAKLYSISET